MDVIGASVQAIADAVRISYGPCGKDQLVVTESQKLVTNSASRILALARPGSPVAKVLLRHLCKFAEEAGDGTATLALLLDGAVRFCVKAINDGRASRQELLRCFAFIEAAALKESAQLLQEIQSGGPVEMVFSNLAKTFFGANFPLEVSGKLSQICWQWLKANSREELSATAGDLRRGELIKVPLVGPTSTDAADSTASATLERQHLMSAVLAHSTMPCDLGEGRAAVLDDHVVTLPVRVTAPGNLLDRLQQHLLLAAEQLWQAGIRLVFCASCVHEEWTGSLARRGICLLHLVDEEELGLLEGKVGKIRRIRPGSEDVAALTAGSFSLQSLRPFQSLSAAKLAGTRAFWHVKPKSEDTPCTLVLAASSLGIEHRLAILRLLAVVAPGLEDPSSIVHGGLAFELGMLRLAHSKVLSLRAGSRAGAELFGLEDDKAARLEMLSWSLLEAALLSVLETFLANMGEGSASSKRTARLLVTLPEAELREMPGLQAIGQSKVHFGFVLSPGIGCQATWQPTESSRLKHDLLRALCSLGRQFCRLDPATVKTSASRP
ncbi:unnamed protein product [Effrenium voratum]|uniref:Uncharacterized protein n=1 Tax=Effrenium voratum TaxID=2562239 RepID=A0AA36MZN4_9DINO|nr:unnamed protein product [Effrenium voratum]CAJ1461293.1 unnamed protein product [Effrenium voratum]